MNAKKAALAWLLTLTAALPSAVRADDFAAPFGDALAGIEAGIRRMGEEHARAEAERRQAETARRQERIRREMSQAPTALTLDLEGVLELARPVSLVATDGRRMPLEDGPVTLTRGAPNLGYFFRDERLVAVNQGGRVAVFPDQRSEGGFEFNDFETDAGAQGLVLSGEDETSIISRVERDGTSACTHAGYCTACSAGIGINGQMRTDCSFKYNLTCPGVKDVRERVTVTRTVTTVSFIAPTDRTVVATVTAAPRRRQHVEHLRDLSSCR